MAKRTSSKIKVIQVKDKELYDRTVYLIKTSVNPFKRNSMTEVNKNALAIWNTINKDLGQEDFDFKYFCIFDNRIEFYNGIMGYTKRIELRGR